MSHWSAELHSAFRIAASRVGAPSCTRLSGIEMAQKKNAGYKRALADKTSRTPPPAPQLRRIATPTLPIASLYPQDVRYISDLSGNREDIRRASGANPEDIQCRGPEFLSNADGRTDHRQRTTEHEVRQASRSCSSRSWDLRSSQYLIRKESFQQSGGDVFEPGKNKA
jgi:hypothetical protein